jgi:CheY-like chemotaxis protein
MINDFLDFTQISNGKLSLNPELFSPETMLLDISKLIKFQAKRKGLTFHIENRFPDRQQCLLRSDPNRIKQIILNLLGNSLKFTQNGYIRIIIEPINVNEIICDQKFGLPVKFSVQDTGLGIKPEDRSHLFQLFGKLKNKDNQRLNQTGVGLGLTISQNLVKALNNNLPEYSISVDSEYGKGSTFSFIIMPFKNDYQEEDCMCITSVSIENGVYMSHKEINNDVRKIRESITIKKNKNLRKDNQSIRLLIVDDDQINILVLTSFLKSFQDCNFDVAFNGLEAIQKVIENGKIEKFYDLILMDCNMPVMDGFEATKVILDMVQKGEIPKLFIIAITANSSPADNKKCFDCGMIDFLSKPFTKLQIREKIDRFY